MHGWLSKSKRQEQTTHYSGIFRGFLQCPVILWRRAQKGKFRKAAKRLLVFLGGLHEKEDSEVSLAAGGLGHEILGSFVFGGWQDEFLFRRGCCIEAQAGFAADMLCAA